MSLVQPDPGVLRKAQRGDERAFTLILRTYETPVFNYVLRLVGGDRSLSVDLKMALLLRDVVGLSYTEIADSLEITLATVKWRIYKAREEVQLALGREGISFGAEPAAVEHS